MIKLYFGKKFDYTPTAYTRSIRHNKMKKMKLNQLYRIKIACLIALFLFINPFITFTQKMEVPKNIDGESFLSFGKLRLSKITPDFSKIVTISASGLMVWDTNESEIIRWIQKEGNGITAFAIDRNAKNIWTGYSDGSMKHLNIESQNIKVVEIKEKEAFSFKHYHATNSDAVRIIEYLPEKKLLISVCKNFINVFNSSNFKKIKSIKNPKGHSISSLTISPNGETIAIGTTNYDIHFISIKSGLIINSIKSSSKYVNSSFGT